MQKAQSGVKYAVLTFFRALVAQCGCLVGESANF